MKQYFAAAARMLVVWPIVFPAFCVAATAFAVECILLGHDVYGDGSRYEKIHKVSYWIDRKILGPLNNWIDTGEFKKCSKSRL